MSTQQTIQCTWCGREADDVSVIGASSKEEARQAAMEFFRNGETGCDDYGITLDDGYLSRWSYDEPQPDDWQDHYVFRAVDAHLVDQREWWEK
jgi:hypothetical protein